VVSPRPKPVIDMIIYSKLMKIERENTKNKQGIRITWGNY